MKQIIFRKIFLALAICIIPISACGSKTQQPANTEAAMATATAAAPASKFVPDKRFANIDTLADFMMTGLWETTTPEELLKRFKEQSLAIKSYWSLSRKRTNKEDMTNTVISDLGKLAESLSDGSTFDMVQSGEIEAAISRYLMAKDYNERYQDNSLYIEEMRNWLALEKELNDYGASWAYVQNWGGSLAHLIASGFTSTTATCRQKSYSQLRRGGQVTKCKTSLNEACANFREATSLVPTQDEDLMREPEYKQMVSNTLQSGKKVLSLFNKWLESNRKLCKSEGIPESHTAELVEGLVNNLHSAMD